MKVLYCTYIVDGARARKGNNHTTTTTSTCWHKYITVNYSTLQYITVLHRTTIAIHWNESTIQDLDSWLTLRLLSMSMSMFMPMLMRRFLSIPFQWIPFDMAAPPAPGRGAASGQQKKWPLAEGTIHVTGAWDRLVSLPLLCYWNLIQMQEIALDMSSIYDKPLQRSIQEAAISTTPQYCNSS